MSVSLLSRSRGTTLRHRTGRKERLRHFMKIQLKLNGHLKKHSLRVETNSCRGSSHCCVGQNGVCSTICLQDDSKHQYEVAEFTKTRNELIIRTVLRVEGVRSLSQGAAAGGAAKTLPVEVEPLRTNPLHLINTLRARVTLVKRRGECSPY